MLCVAWTYKLVADASDGQNELRVLGIELELVAQAGNVHVDGARHGIGVISPDRTQELDARYGSAGPFHQVAEQLEFAGGKVDGIAVARDLVAPNVDLNVTKLVDTLARP